MFLVYDLMQCFVSRPDRIWGVAAAVTVIWWLARLAKTRYPQIRAMPLLVAAVLWLAYGFEERDALRARANIRIDLLVIDPVLLFATLMAAILLIDSILRTLLSKAPPPSDRPRP